jgi:hypothetical protein
MKEKTINKLINISGWSAVVLFSIAAICRIIILILELKGV